RFEFKRGRSWELRLRERRAFSGTHTLADERAFVGAQGPVVPDLLEHVHRRGREVDHVLFFTYIYYPTVVGLPLAPERAVLVPTAHDEPAIRLAVYKPVFCAPRAIAFSTVEERAMVHRLFQNERVPNEVVGVGVDAPAGCVALVQPSLLESLSMIALEAWGCGRPVICDARSPVVWGMTYRAGAGLAYRSAAEFAEIGEMLIARPQLASRLGASGQP